MPPAWPARADGESIAGALSGREVFAEVETLLIDHALGLRLAALRCCMRDRRTCNCGIRGARGRIPRIRRETRPARRTSVALPQCQHFIRHFSGYIRSIWTPRSVSARPLDCIAAGSIARENAQRHRSVCDVAGQSGARLAAYGQQLSPRPDVVARVPCLSAAASARCE